jgi:hypothetical protein
MFDERRFLPECARLLFVWRQHGGVGATEDVLCHWARKTAAWTRNFPDPRQAFIGLRMLGLIETTADGDCVLSDEIRPAIELRDTVQDDVEQLTEQLGILLLHRMLEATPFRPLLDQAFGYGRFVGGALITDWRTVPHQEQRNVAWIWLQQLGLARHTGNEVIFSPLLIPFALDVPPETGPLSQAELDIRLQAQKARSLRAEEFIVHLEKERLRSLGFPEYAEGVLRISDDDVTAGFDILSFDVTGERRFIEVKSSSGPRQWFIWSRNEFEVAQVQGSAFWLAWVGWAVRLPDGPCEVAWFQNPTAILQSTNSPWKSESEDYRITRIADDAKLQFAIGLGSSTDALISGGGNVHRPAG